MPHSTHVHKSMLLRGVKLAPKVLNREDIEATKGRASHSGRSFGGIPFGRGRGNGRGRGGQINYANDRPNPFAAHINPSFAPPPSFGRGGPPPQGGQFNNFPPPPPRYNGGPPPGQNGYYNGPPPQSGYGRQNGPPPLPMGGYNNGPHNGYSQGNYGNQNPTGRYGGYNGSGR